MSKRLSLGSPPGLEGKRCAVYTRKSTSAGLDQEFNSLDAQREACEQYIRNQTGLGWQLLSEGYDDGGFTGANLERPGFARLLQDIEDGKIDVVVVYKVDRLSRSLLDFARVMDRFNRAGTAFVSVTQNFSTADAMGRLTLNMLMSFAEFEREMISERTRDKIAASRRKGKWTGGPAPLGYDVVDRKLVVNDTEAALVRRIYDLYLDTRSAMAVAKTLNAQHQTTKHRIGKSGASRGAREWDKNSVLQILSSPISAGLMSSGGEVYDGEHSSIVERSLYDRVQALLADSGGRGAIRHGRNPEYLLTGILRCARCGQAFTPASTRRKSGKVYRYYRCSTRDKKGRTACASAPLPAVAIESFVVERIREALAEGDLILAVAEAASARLRSERKPLEAERAKLPHQIATLSTEGKRLVETASSMNGSARRLLDAKLQEVGDQLGRLEARLNEVQRRLAMLKDIELETQWVERCLAHFDKVWDTLSPDNRTRLVRAVVARVEVDEPNGDVRAFLTDLEIDSAEATQVHEVAS
ncbi:MAG: recombinase family protein [Myxococcota bacterium]|jgi:DNA invertase Pin-like site-specific DNA recombinase|nr:recombinase family protein [Myxococcota bacterium]